MNSDYIDLDTAFVNLDDVKGLVVGSAYRLQNTCGGKNCHHVDFSDYAYIVISDSKPEGRKVAMKSAIVLAPGGDPYEHKPIAGYNAWAFAPFGDTSLSIVPLVMPSARG